MEERIAAEIHAMWASWMEYFLEKYLIMDAEQKSTYIRNIYRQIQTPYDLLTPEEKEADRREARKILRLFQ